jgi:hypothetical protein
VLNGNIRMRDKSDDNECGKKPSCSLPSSGLLRSVRWFDTDVSEIPIVPIIIGQAVFLDCLALDDKTNR